MLNIKDGMEFTENNMLNLITEIREYDLPYHSRVCIDLNIRIANFYKLTFESGYISSF